MFAYSFQTQYMVQYIFNHTTSLVSSVIYNKFHTTIYYMCVLFNVRHDVIYFIQCTAKWCHNFFIFFLAFAFCRFCVVIWFFHTRHNGQWPPTSKDFYPRSYPLHYFLISYKSQYFPFQCWVLNKQTTGTIFITSLVWRGPWLGIEPGTSRTRSQHSTTRLSRRRLVITLISRGMVWLLSTFIALW